MTATGALWPAGSATAPGQFPGEDPLAAARVVTKDVPGLPFLPELPARGAGAMREGRTAALLVGLHVDLVPAGWRLVPRPGADERGARGLLAEDLDAFEEAADGYSGPLKVHALGPWTLLTLLELPRGEKALVDRGACRDLALSLTEGLIAHVAELRRRVPGITTVAVELDEGRLPDVMAGRISTASGWGRLWSVEEVVAEDQLTGVLEALADAGAVPGLRLDVPDPPLNLARRAGARFVACDRPAFESASPDDLGEAFEAGLGVILGLIPASGGRLPEVEEVVAPLRHFRRVMGLPAALLAAQILPAVTKGLEDLSVDAARAALRRSADVARDLEEALDV